MATGHHVEIPHRELSEEALRGVVESFVLREGTDYGQRDYSLEEKIAAVVRQIERGEAVIVFDPESATVSIVAASPADRRTRPQGGDGTGSRPGVRRPARPARIRK